MPRHTLIPFSSRGGEGWWGGGGESSSSSRKSSSSSRSSTERGAGGGAGGNKNDPADPADPADWQEARAPKRVGHRGEGKTVRCPDGLTGNWEISNTLKLPSSIAHRHDTSKGVAYHIEVEARNDGTCVSKRRGARRRQRGPPCLSN